jgi:hypothetical protein
MRKGSGCNYDKRNISVVICDTDTSWIYGTLEISKYKRESKGCIPKQIYCFIFVNCTEILLKVARTYSWRQGLSCSYIYEGAIITFECCLQNPFYLSKRTHL